MKSVQNKLYRLLRWSEKYTKTDMLYLARGGFWLSFGEIVSSIFVLATAIAFANLLPKEVYGTYKYILSLFGIFSFFTLVGLNTSLIQSISRGYERIFTDVLKIKIKYGFIGSFLSVCAASYYYLNANTTLALGLLIIGLFVPFFDSFSIYTSLLKGRKRFDTLVKYRIVGQFFVSIITILVLFLTDSLFILLFAYFSLWLTVRILFYFRILKKEPINNELDEEVISYGKHLSFMGVFRLIEENLDKILLWHFVGPVQLAVYFFALAPVTITMGPINSLAAIALPKLSSGSFEEIKKTFLRKMFILFLFLIPIVFIYILISPYVFKLIFPQYLDSIQYTKVFALSMLLAPSAFIQQILFAHKKKKELYIVQILIPLVKILLLITLLPLYGVWGAIYAILFTLTFGLILNLLLIYRK